MSYKDVYERIAVKLFDLILCVKDISFIRYNLLSILSITWDKRKSGLP